MDDDAEFLTGIKELFSEMAHGKWDIFTAENHSQALALLTKLRVDVVVLDIGMPIMDGIQFLQLLGRKPRPQVVMLTGNVTEEKRARPAWRAAPCYSWKSRSRRTVCRHLCRARCVGGGAAAGRLRGMMRRVGLQEVLQLAFLVSATPSFP